MKNDNFITFSSDWNYRTYSRHSEIMWVAVEEFNSFLSPPQNNLNKNCLQIEISNRQKRKVITANVWNQTGNEKNRPSSFWQFLLPRYNKFSQLNLITNLYTYILQSLIYDPPDQISDRLVFFVRKFLFVIKSGISHLHCKVENMNTSLHPILCSIRILYYILLLYTTQDLEKRSLIDLLILRLIGTKR